MLEKEDLGKYAIICLVLVGLMGILLFFRGSPTGFAIFSDSGISFNLGTYVNTTYNGSAVVLVGSNLSGGYTSKIFDAGDVSVWNNITKTQNIPSIEFLFSVDGGGDVYKSTNLGVTWIMSQEDYGRTTATEDMFSNSKYLYILSSAGNEVWNSSDGTGFVVIYNDFEGKSPLVGGNHNDDLYVVTGPGEIWKSSNNGLAWNKQGDFNEASTNDPKGIAIDSNGYIYVVSSAGNVFKSTDSGVNWTKVNDGYGGSTGTDGMVVDSSNNLYILLNSKVYKSTDGGVTWSIINDDFSPYANDGFVIGIDSNNNLHIYDGIGRVFKSIDLGVSWNELGDFNGGASNDPKGCANFVRNSSLSFQARSCDDAACSGESWVSVTNFLNLGVSNNRYFQYKIDFTSPDSSITPILTNINIDYTLVNTAPIINLALPQDGTSYSVRETINLNFSASDNDNNLQFCWYNIDSGNNISLPGCSNKTISASSIGTGSHTLFVYANDSLGLVGSNSTSFSVTNTAPVVSIASPQNGATYGYNESLALDFSVFDIDDNLQSCWYSINNEANISLNDCVNTTFNVAGNGDYTLIIYANDSLGLIASDFISFSVAVGSPTIILNSPIGSYLNYKDNIIFSYTPTDIDLDYCELWGNFDGEFKLNQTDSSPNNGVVNTFTLSLPDGTYLWNIRCVDDMTHSTFNGNKTFYVDTTKPSISLSQPTGTKTSRTVSASWSVSDASPISCKYNVYRGENLEITNTSINCSANSASFEVTVDANFVFNFYVNDSAGNTNSANSSFSVDTSTPSSPPSSGGSSGGGGSFILPNQTGKLQVSLIGNIVARPGDNKKISLTVKNIGRIFLNKCKLIASGEAGAWIYSDKINGIAPGETLDFVFDLNIPEEINPGDYSGELEIKCEEGNNVQGISVSIPVFNGVTIGEIIQNGRILVINYTFDNSDFIGEFVVIDIWISDEAGNEVKRIQDKFDINKEGLIERNVKIEVVDLSGVYYVYFALSSNLEEFVKQSIILGKSSSTSFTILDITKNKVTVYVIFVLFIGIAVFLIWRRHSKTDKINSNEVPKHHWLLRKKK